MANDEGGFGSPAFLAYTGVSFPPVDYRRFPGVFLAHVHSLSFRTWRGSSKRRATALTALRSSKDWDRFCTLTGTVVVGQFDSCSGNL
jgi:hypothetical protein